MSTQLIEDLRPFVLPLVRFKAIIIGHDDTVVDSSRLIHHPAHIESMRVLRPDHIPCSLSEWFSINASPGGLMKYYQDLQFTKEEYQKEHEMWLQYSQATHIPRFYDGILTLLKKIQSAGVPIIICSNSPSSQIIRHYVGTGVFPNAIYGWNPDKTLNKPHPWPVHDTVRRLGLTSPNEVCVIDDMTPGIKMARIAGAFPICAAWGPTFDLCHDVRQYMKDNSVYICPTVNDLANMLGV